MSEKRNRKKPLFAVQLAKVAFFFVFIIGATFCAAAYSTVKNDFSDSTIAFLALFCAGISVLATGFVAGKVFERAEMLSGVIVGAVGFAIVAVLALANGETTLSIHSAIRFLLLVSCGGLGGLVAIHSNEKRRKKHR